MDLAERASELYTLCLATAGGKVKPVTAYYDCRMVNMWRTPIEPMKSFVARMQSLEGKDGILSISFGHGFPYADVEEVGAKMVVITNNDPAKAASLAEQLGRELWDMRERTLVPHDTIDGAIDAALAGTDAGPVVLADVADNAGGGAPSDNTAILHRLVDRSVQHAVIGCFWDPQAVQFCREAGEGGTFTLRIGGKCGVASGNPVDLRVMVRALAESHSQSGLSGGRTLYGPSAWVHADGIDIVLTTKRQQVFTPEAFTGLGITLADKRIVVVKSTQHFYAGFAPVAGAIRYVSAPGAVPPTFEAIPFTKRMRPYWPRVSDPFEQISPA